VHDGIELEKRGVPSVSIASEPFRPGLDALCEMRGMPNYRFAIVEHPIGSANEEGLRKRAHQAVEQIVESVLHHPDRPRVIPVKVTNS
jgi:hypothetical protein